MRGKHRGVRCRAFKGERHVEGYIHRVPVTGLDSIEGVPPPKVSPAKIPMTDYALDSGAWVGEANEWMGKKLAEDEDVFPGHPEVRYPPPVTVLP